MRAAVFIDRDDTLVPCRDVTAATPYPGELIDPALVRLCEGAGEACARLAGRGLALVLITNQGAVARGHASLRQVEAVNDRIRELLRSHGVRLAGVYYCPFHPEGAVSPFNREHAWRKPDAGMLLAAAEELELDLAQSWTIGDAARDVLAGVTAGIASARSIIVGKGPGVWYKDLAAAVQVILPQLESQAPAP